MNELFNLKPVEIAGHQIRAVDARELHTFLEVGRDFSTWIKDRIDQYGFIEGIDYVVAKFGENILNGTEFDSPNLGNQKQRGGDRRSKEYALSLDTAKELSMVENNEQGRIARRYFIECEKRLIAISPEQHRVAADNWRKNRVHTCDFHKRMCTALVVSRARQDKPTKAHHYINEDRMLNKILLGMDAEQWKVANGVTGELRDNLSADQLEYLAYLEHTNTTLLEMDMDFQQRKEKLTELLARHLLEKAA